MKKNIIYILFISLTLSISSCSKDDDTATSAVCLTCDSFDTPLCVGSIDDETGEVVTEEMIDITKSLFEAFGTTCTKS